MNILDCLIANPELMSQWHQELNKDVDKSLKISNRKAWWKCSKGLDHVWMAPIRDRLRFGCPYCAGVKTCPSNCLAKLRPEIAEKWHPVKNGNLTPHDVTTGSSMKVWWQCPKFEDHVWQSTVNDHANKGNVCPCCLGRKIVMSNCLAMTHPRLASEWHLTKNVVLTPYDVTAGIRKQVWWQCSKSKDHEWKASIGNRTNLNTGCPCCNGKKVVLSNCLTTTNPEIASQWHLTKNVVLTPYDVTAGSHKRVWWQCSKTKDHEWTSSVYARSSGQGCPICRHSKGEKIIAKLLDDLGIDWRSQFRLNKCRYIRPLPFDFVIRIDNKIGLIEYQGIQHYKLIARRKSDNYNMMLERYNEIIMRDRIKREFCKEHELPLLEISYKDFDNIGQKVNQFLTNIKRGLI